MYQTLLPLSALLLGTFLLLAGMGLQGTLLPVRATIEDFSTLEIGFFGSAYFAGFVLGCLRAPHLVRAVGHIRVFAALVVVISAIPLLHVIVIGPAAWAVFRAITGFCMAGVYMVVESWISERAPGDRRGAVLALYNAVSLGAIALGQLLLPLYAPQRFELFTMASILVSFAAVPVALTRTTAPAQLTKVAFPLRRLLGISPVGVAGCLAVGLASGAFWTVGPAFAIGVGLNVQQVAIFMSVTVIGGALGQWPFGTLSDRTDRRRVIAVAAGLAGLSGVGLFVSGMLWPPAMLACAFLYGASSFPIYALSISHVYDQIPSEDFVDTSGGLLLTHGLGAVAGPFAGAAAMSFGTPAGLFLYIALVLFVLVVFVLYRMRRRVAPPEEQQVPFLPMSGATTAVTTIDPRGEDGGSGPQGG